VPTLQRPEARDGRGCTPRRPPRRCQARLPPRSSLRRAATWLRGQRVMAPSKGETRGKGAELSFDSGTALWKGVGCGGAGVWGCAETVSSSCSCTCAARQRARGGGGGGGAHSHLASVLQVLQVLQVCRAAGVCLPVGPREGCPELVKSTPTEHRRHTC